MTENETAIGVEMVLQVFKSLVIVIRSFMVANYGSLNFFFLGVNFYRKELFSLRISTHFLSMLVV